MSGGHMTSETFGAQEVLEWGWAWPAVATPNAPVPSAEWVSDLNRLRRQQRANAGVGAEFRGRNQSARSSKFDELG